MIIYSESSKRLHVKKTKTINLNGILWFTVFSFGLFYLGILISYQLDQYRASSKNLQITSSVQTEQDFVKKYQIEVEPREYVVQEGDSLWRIAKKFKLDFQNLLTYNQLGEKTILQKGTRINIPVQVKVYQYRVRPGDTLWQVAKEYNIPLKLLIEENQLDATKPLYVGQSIRIRVNTKES